MPTASPKRARTRAAAGELNGHAAVRLMLDHASQGIALFDAGHRLTGWNDPFQEMLAIAPSVLSNGLTFAQFIRIVADRGDFGPRSEGVDAAMRELTTSLDTDYSAERMLPDGRVLQCRRRPSPEGGLVLTYTDVTEQRHSDYLVKDSERQTRTILDKAPVALAVIDPEDGALKHVNSRFRRLFALAEQVSPDKIELGDFLNESDLAHIHNATASDGAFQFESRIRRHDGAEFWASITPVRFVFEWAPAVLVGFYDITDRRVAEEKLREELGRKQAELAEARTLQLELVPPSVRDTIGAYAFSADVVLEPAMEVGGDLIDYLRVDDKRLVLVIGDVSQKGAGAALFMARTHSLVHSLASRPDAAAFFRDPAEAVRVINAALARNNATCMFVTLLVATFDGESGELAYVRAGHVPPFLRRATGAIERLSAPGGPPIGLKENARYSSARVVLVAGDRLLAMTDGVTEAADPSGTLFGDARVEEFLSNIDATDAGGVAPLIAAVRRFEAGQPSSDDIAAFLFTISAASEPDGSVG